MISAWQTASSENVTEAPMASNQKMISTLLPYRMGGFCFMNWNDDSFRAFSALSETPRPFFVIHSVRLRSGESPVPSGMNDKGLQTGL
jgi:hypothetical protein